MITRLLLCLVLLIPATACLSSGVSTDKDAYTVGETVYITFTNTLDTWVKLGPDYAFWIQSGATTVLYDTASMAVFIPAHGTLTIEHDTGALPDPVGDYSVITHHLGSFWLYYTSWTLTDGVPNEHASWSQVKQLYR